ncbi:MAG: sensor histidine kinase [Wujia sp.]
MIKTLQKRFIVTAMVAISILLVVLIGAINILNIWRVNNETDNMMAMLVREEERDIPEPPGKPGPKGHNIFNPDISEDMAMAARYFLVRMDSCGEIVYTDISRISSVEEETANEYARMAVQSGDSEGAIDNFRYRITDSEDGQGSIVIFLNISDNRSTILAVLLISVGIGCIGWMLMLLLVLVLSKRAIRPIALNIEKQKQFVTDAGHEIKTPLAIIMANTDAMELHNGANKWSKNIRTQTERLAGLMKNLLTLSRMDEGDIPPVMTDIDLGGLVREVVDTFQESAGLRHIRINAELKGDLHVCANREQMVQLVSILLDNAVKYSPMNECIEVVLDGNQKETILKCRNVCDSLPQDPADRLFDRFYRGDAARTQKNGGYGIGLSVARAIVETHRGTIKAEYDSGKYITFTVIM